jgi:DNA-binding response OmpR family regulator
MPKVLIVEDEMLIRFALADALVDAGHVVIECGTVLEAVAAFSRHDKIEALITDVDMPGGLTGLDLARLVRTTRLSIPIWVTSGRRVDVSHIKGAVFLTKPYDFTALARTVTDHIERSSWSLSHFSSRYRSYP